MRDAYPDVADIKRRLQARRVTFGIKQEVLHHLCERRICNRGVVAAQGRAPVAGEGARIECIADQSRRGQPRELDGGRVDLRDLQNVLNVKKGEPLARRIPPRPGVDGMAVDGTVIPAPAPPDVRLRAGAGVAVSASDPDMLIAAEDGAVVVGRDHTISIIQSKTFTGDIDYATGNVAFAGDLIINGSVRAGFSVRARGSIMIRGGVEDAEVECGGDLTICRGASGSEKGVLSAQGAITVHHLERFAVRGAADVVVEEDIVHSDVKAEGWVRARTIVGGTVRASSGVDAKMIGAAAETRTEIDMGAMAEMVHQRTELLRDFGKKASRAAKEKEALYQFVRDQMDERGTLTEQQQQRLHTLRESCLNYIKEYAEAGAAIEKLEQAIEQRPNPVVRAEQILPNTLIHCGAEGKLIKTQLHRCLISFKDNRLIIAKT
jgi:uncharacterized protein (DUF342 family)